MSNVTEKYELYLAASGATDEQLDEERRNLQRELNELDDVEGVKQISAGTAPANARAIDLVIIGGLALALKQAGVFDAVVNVLKEWIEQGNRRKERRKVLIKRSDGTVLEFDGYSFKEIRELGDVPGAGGKS
jgi:Effector Associated Constant Component 1